MPAAALGAVGTGPCRQLGPPRTSPCLGLSKPVLAPQGPAPHIPSETPPATPWESLGAPLLRLPWSWEGERGAQPSRPRVLSGARTTTGSASPGTWPAAWTPTSPGASTASSGTARAPPRWASWRRAHRLAAETMGQRGLGCRDPWGWVLVPLKPRPHSFQCPGQ